MDFLRELTDRLPFLEKGQDLVRRLPVPGLRGAVLLEIDLTRGLSETTPANPIEALRARNTPALHDVVEGLRHAVTDDKVAGLVVHASSQVTLTAAQELRRALLRFRTSGKPTLAWTESFGELVHGTSGYLTATSCEQIWVQPSGDVSVHGVVASGLFLRGALDKIGVLPEFARRKEYKSAAEMYLSESMSEPNREMLTAIVESVNATIVADIAQGRAERGVTPESARALLEEGSLTVGDALERGFIDAIGYRDEAFAWMRERIEDPEEKKALTFVERYGKAAKGSMPTGVGSRPGVAIVHAQGPIHLGRAGGQSPMGGHSVGSDSLTATLRAARRDKAIRAVVLRVDSPGGSYIASDAIRAEILALRESGTRIVASMGHVAASGGYFISMPCERILADPATLTGSIGVLAGKNVIEQGLHRLGINRESVSAYPYDEMFSGLRPFTTQEWARLDGWLDDVYDDFTTKAAADRGMPLEQLEPLARGRVWSGVDARLHGLIDDLGGLDDGIALACELAGLDRADAEVQVLPKLGPFDRFLPTENSDSPVGASLGEGLSLFDRATLALGLSPTGVLTMPPVRLG